ncbi:MAG: FAD-binding protein, partial [Planctomycetes bacterium]|nr:FAD-binding protein [Planctomycetota bacterium]
GQQLIYGLDEQVRRYEEEGNVRKFEFWEMLRIIKDEQGRTAGIVAINMHSMQIESFPGDAVIIATGGPGMVFGHGTTNSLTNSGAAVIRTYLAGAKYANAEFVQVHPTTIPGHDKLRLMSESIRGEGGRIWVPRKKGDDRQPQDIPEKERLYFLEEKYPAYGNLVPRDIATREIFTICVNQGMGVGGRNEAYLDITHLVRDKGADWVEKKLGNLLDIYEKFVGDDPRKVPMRIFPGMHYSMGGIWVQYHLDENAPEETGKIDLEHPHNFMTNIDGLYAAGECDYQYHGANRLGANALLSCIHTGLRLAGPASYMYTTEKDWVAEDLPQSLFENEKNIEIERFEEIKHRDGGENIFDLWNIMGESMTKFATVVRTNEGLQELDNILADVQDKIGKVSNPDLQTYANQTLLFTRCMEDMIILGRMIAQTGIARQESRGAHYKEITEEETKELPESRFQVFEDPDGTKHYAYTRNDEDWLKTTICVLDDEKTGNASISYEDVDLSISTPVLRDYTKVVKAK